ncbi:hypothetical protein C943_03974 [Mariniradius saccharolyticus AK6]|uniref:Uncharacterized protein n=1 Tax=Mariniradius saccharolyticus AK6 TaxID=1239962 RepID=M7Y074_9BACT|nr:hypothetical protein C943_03974 [Mariniradius saccharolyticus AK6]
MNGLAIFEQKTGNRIQNCCIPFYQSCKRDEILEICAGRRA